MTGIISDVHGNFPALEKVVSELRSRGCDEIVCLGDVAGYYSMINECIDLIRREGIICLKGNHDSYLLGEADCPRSRSANDCIAYQRRVLTEENREWLRGLKPALEAAEYHAVHGGWRDPIDEYITEFDFDEPAVPKEGPAVYLTGHTHMQTLQRRGRKIYCNPGSVGQPRDYDPRAGYAVLHEGEITLHRAEYDIPQIAAAMDAAGFNDYYYRNLYHGCKIGEKVTKGAGK